MYLNEFKCWLKGYLEGVGVESKEDLEKEDLLLILSKFEEVMPTYKMTSAPFPFDVRPTVYGSIPKRLNSIFDELLK
jgi:hypothetical protein